MTCTSHPDKRTTWLIDWAVMGSLALLTAAGIRWLFLFHSQGEQSTWIVAIAAGITAVTTGFGAIPFLIGRCPNRHWTGIGNALAAGLMLGASLSLFVQGWNIQQVSYSWVRLLCGAGVGMILIMLAHRLLSGKEDLTSPESIEKSGLLRIILVVGVMTVHSFAEGMGVGVSYGDGSVFGDFIAMSIAIHNIPEGLAISLIMIPRGSSVARASLWSVFSSLPQPLVAVPSYLLVMWFRPVLPVGLGLAGGAMLWMVFHELIPEAKSSIRTPSVVALVAVGTAGMFLFQALMPS
jgi:zinc transporter ZupT